MIAKMKRLFLVVEDRKTAGLISELGFLRIVELSDLKDSELVKEYDGFLSVHHLNRQIAQLEEQKALLDEALTIAQPYRTEKKGLFTPPKELDRAQFEALGDRLEEALERAHVLSELSARLEQNEKTQTELEALIASYKPWEALETPLNLKETATCLFQLAVLPARFDETQFLTVLADAGAHCVPVSGDAEHRYFQVIYHKADREKMRAILAGFQVTQPRFPEVSGRAGDLIAASQDQLDTLKREREQLKDAVISGARDAQTWEFCADYLDAKIGLCRAREELLYSETCAFLKGYLKEKDLARFERAVADLPVSYEYEEIGADEQAPVALENPKLFKPFESVIALYSYPSYHGYDPTIVMSLFYFVLFGMMLADVVYGFLMTVCCLMYLKLARPRGALYWNMQLFAICGVSMMICGALFGGIAGDFPSVFSQRMLGGGAIETALVVNPVTDPMTFLYLSVGFGAIHLICGMGVKFYMLCRKRRVFDAICDIGMWYLVFGGLIALLLGAGDVGKWILIAGVAGLVLTGGRAEKNPVKKLFKGFMALYGVIDYVSDLLSYSRVLALGLASAVIASVMNTMAMLFGPSVLGYLVMTVILIIGHSVNLLINLLGAYVHTGRLQYIEFFGKFYEDGGVPFTPLGYEPKHFVLLESDKNG